MTLEFTLNHEAPAQAAAQRAWRAVFETVDFVLFPPCAVPAFPHDQSPLGTRTFMVNGQAMPVDSISR